MVNMIKVIVLKDKDKYKKINILGHALYDEYGKDIVCSAVSSIVTTTINGILMLNKESLDYDINDEGMNITIMKCDDITKTLIDNMLNLLKDLEEKYPDNISVK